MRRGMVEKKTAPIMGLDVVTDYEVWAINGDDAEKIPSSFDGDVLWPDDDALFLQTCGVFRGRRLLFVNDGNARPFVYESAFFFDGDRLGPFTIPPFCIQK